MPSLRKIFSSSVPKWVGVAGVASLAALFQFRDAGTVKVNLKSYAPAPLEAPSAELNLPLPVERAQASENLLATNDLFPHTFTLPELELSDTAEKIAAAAPAVQSKTPAAVKKVSAKKLTKKKVTSNKTVKKFSKSKRAFLAKKRARRASRKMVVVAPKPKMILAALPTHLEFDESAEEEAQQAVNYPDPIGDVLDRALSESPLTAFYDSNPMLSAAQMETALFTHTDLPQETEVRVVMGEIAPQRFDDHEALLKKARLAKAEIILPALPEVPKREEKRQPTLAAASSLLALNQIVAPASETSVAVKKAPETKRITKQQIEQEVAETRKIEESATLEVPQEAESVDEPTPQAPTQISAQQVEVPEGTPVESTPATVAPESVVLDATQELETEVVSTESAADMTTQAAPEVVSQVLAGMSNLPQPRQASSNTVASKPVAVEETHSYIEESASERANAITEIDDRLFGEFQIDRGVQGWLSRSGGHVELFLHPVGSRDSQDRIHIGAVQAGEDFEVDNIGLKGSYRLFANFFRQGRTDVQGLVTYPEVITPENYKKRLRFFVTTEELKKAVSARKKPSASGSVVLTVPVFEAAAGDYRNPQAVSNAEVSVLGFEHWGKFKVDSTGTIRIENVPAHSDLILNVKTDNHWKSSKIVTTFGTDTHVPLYLLSNKDLGTISFNKGGNQDLGKGILMGRTFDPESRTPSADEQVQMSFRKSRPLYFDPIDEQSLTEQGLFGAWAAMSLGAIPNMSLERTSKLGLFGFFNVVPSLRVLYREGKHPVMHYVGAGEVSYLEFGRGGLSKLKARLIDPFGSEIRNPEVRFAGGSALPINIDQHGRFSIPQVDYSGKVTLEVNADGYPSTWHDISFNAGETASVNDLFLLDKDVLWENFAAIEKSSGQLRHEKNGNLVGGVESKFLKNSGCLNVRLLDAEGKATSTASGPYALGVASTENKALCLNKEHPGFVFVNLKPGRYLQQLVGPKGNILRTRVHHIGAGKVTMSVQQ